MAFIYRFCSYCRRASHEHSFWNHSCKVLIIHLQSSSHLMTCEIPLIVCPDFCSSLWLCSHFEKQDTSLPIFTSPQQSCCLLTCHVSKNGSVGKCKVTMSQRGPAPCWSRLLFVFFFPLLCVPLRESCLGRRRIWIRKYHWNYSWWIHQFHHEQGQ